MQRFHLTALFRLNALENPVMPMAVSGFSVIFWVFSTPVELPLLNILHLVYFSVILGGAILVPMLKIFLYLKLYQGTAIHSMASPDHSFRDQFVPHSLSGWCSDI